MASAQIKPEESMYHKDNGVMHHLSSLIASQGSNVPIVRVEQLFDSEILTTERRHELADQVTKKFALPQNYQPYTVVYVEQIEAFLGIDLRRLLRD
jgi:hypothetical protein